MKTIIVKNYDEMSKVGADIFAQIILDKPNGVIGLATGSTPIGLYKKLIEKCTNGEISFKGIHTVNLDEYMGLPSSHEQSYAFFMRDNLFNHIDIDINNTNIENGVAPDAQAECERYNKVLDELRPDIQLLGIGSNGHIAFNEPGTPFDSVTHVVELTESTIKDNSRLFDSIDEVPTHAFTMGIKNIMNAKKILILASGANKAKAVYRLLKEKITEDLPASILNTHADCTLICDEAAASLINNI